MLAPRTRYLSSFHFITATLMAFAPFRFSFFCDMRAEAVGYGDIFPSNSLERIACAVS